MNYYFVVIIFLYSMNIGMNLAKNGMPREGNYNFLTATIAAIICITLIYLAIKKGL